jgi:sec-independent protein translocase protein TatA
MFGLQPIHIVLIVLVAILIFGPKKLPEFGKSLGKSIREFKQASKEMSEDFKSTVDAKEDETASSKPQ